MTLLRILGSALLTAGLGAVLGCVLFGQYSDWTGVSLFLGCAAGLVGAVAGAAHEIAASLRQRLAP